MTKNKNEKRAAREFSRRHGVSYTEALRTVLRLREESMRTGEPIIIATQLAHVEGCWCATGNTDPRCQQKDAQEG